MRKRFGVALGAGRCGRAGAGDTERRRGDDQGHEHERLGSGVASAAINQANDLAGADRIVITATGTISLGYSLPTPDTDLAIAGPGPGSSLSAAVSSVPVSAVPTRPPSTKSQRGPAPNRLSRFP